MKLKLTIFLISLFLVALGIGIWIGSATKTTAYNRLGMPTGYAYGNPGAGFGAGLAVFGLGAGIGIPWILKQRNPS